MRYQPRLTREAGVIDKSYVELMARYNEWQNANLYGAADQLADAERRCERGAFFGSIAGTPKPEGGIKGSVSRHPDWQELKRERAAFDRLIIEWASSLDPRWLAGDLAYFSGAAGREIKRPKWFLLTHMFNHQTHHRGQVHCLLTQSGAKPGDTDLPFLRL